VHEIVIIYASEDLKLVECLAALLKKHWESIWFAEEEISSGEWDKQVQQAIANTHVVVALTSKVAVNKPIFKDEMNYAISKNKPLLPFAIEEIEMPLGLGNHSRTNAYGWTGEEEHLQFQKLLKKISKEMKGQSLVRKRTLLINGKEFALPGFVFSLSSHETQIIPKEGLELFSRLKQPAAVLVSAYDAWFSQKDKVFNKWVRELKNSECFFCMDSGNYESHRKNDIKNKANPDGWCNKKFIAMVIMHSPDIAFSFDSISPKGDFKQVLSRVVRNTRSDQKKIGHLPTEICPIVHIPDKIIEGISIEKFAARLVTEVATNLDPSIIAIPERELGHGIVQRIKAVKSIRASLNELGKYYPLHLLGTGNPMSLIPFAEAGADSFDGLEWCRTVSDWETLALYHFQHLDFFLEHYISQIPPGDVRDLLGSDVIPYAMKVACFNMEVMNDYIGELQAMARDDKIQYMRKRVLPHEGKRIEI